MREPDWKSDDGSIRLFWGDCREILPQVDGIDSILADPPYGMGYRSHHNSGRQNSGEWKQWIRDTNFEPIEGDDTPFDPSHLLKCRQIILWGANFYADRLPAARGWLYWDKLENMRPCDQADGEMAWTNLPIPIRRFSWAWRGLIRRGKENVAKAHKLHPNQKPVALMSWCLGLMKQAGVVCDPYMGSGTTGIACIRSGCQFVGIEKSEQFFDVAVKRIKSELRQPFLMSMAE